MCKFVQFTKRTNDPKLEWLEKRLSDIGIESRRNGYSWHAPILEIPEDRLEEAHRILDPVDDWEDDDPRFELDSRGEAYPWDLPEEE